MLLARSRWRSGRVARSGSSSWKIHSTSCGPSRAIPLGHHRGAARRGDCFFLADFMRVAW